MIEKCPNPPKDNEKCQKKVRLNEKGICACNNGKNNSYQKIFASMAPISDNENFPSENFGESSQLTKWNLDSGSTYHMTPEISDFIPGSLEDMDKHIEVVDGHHVTEKQKGQVRIKM